MSKIGYIVSLCYLSAVLSGQNGLVDSLKKVLTTHVNDTSRISVLFKLVDETPAGEWQIYNEEINRRAIEKLEKGHLNSELEKFYLKSLAESFHNIGVDLCDKSNYYKSLQAYKKSIAIRKKLGDTSDAAYSQVDVAKIYATRAYYSKAADILYESLRLFEQLNDKEGIGDVYLNLGNIYQLQKNNLKAITFYEKSLEYYRHAGYEDGTITALNNMAGSYINIDQFDKAVLYYKKCFEVIAQLDKNKARDVDQLLHMGLGHVAMEKRQWDSAIVHYSKSLEYLQSIDARSFFPSRYRCIGAVYFEKEDYKKALLYLNDALAYSKTFQNVDEERKASSLLYMIHKKLGNHKQALVAHEVFLLLTDSVKKKEDERHLMEQQMKHEFDKKMLLEKAERDKKLNAIALRTERKNSRKNIWIIALLSVLIFLATGAYFLFNYFKQRAIIESQKGNILQQKLLVSQMNPHFIFNSLNAIQNYIISQNSLKAGIYLSQFADLIRMILDFSRREYITLESELKFLKIYLELQQLRFEHKFEYRFLIDETISQDLVLVPPMLAQPFIENAIEHGIFYKKEKGHITISITKTNDNLQYVIEDDGVGLDASLKFKAQKKNEHESLAVKIAGERIENLYSGYVTGRTIEIVDKIKLNPLTAGVKVTFAIPYKEV